MSFTVKPATRQHVRPLIGLYSESGCGKTFGSLMLARGLAGPTGTIVMIDTESGRGSLYADVIPGGYSVIDLGEPFSPSRYAEALEAAEKEQPSCVVIDSMSHEWEGPGGVVDSAGESEQRSGKPGLHNWKTPKLEHAKLVQRQLRSTVPLICCIRAKYKSRQQRNEQGKTVIVKDDFTSPIQSEDYIFEMTVHGEVMPDHTFRLTKCSHPDLKKCFPENAPLEIRHGELLAKWCANPGGKSAPKSTPKVDALKKALWTATKSVHHGDVVKLHDWLREHNIIGPDDLLELMPESQLIEVNDKADIVLREGKQ